jgi:vesicle transport protein SEC22
MVLMTMIARIADGLPLAASVQEEEQTGRSLLEYQAQAKQLFRRMNNNSPVRGSLESGQYLFHYFIERGVCYLVLCEKTFSKRQAFTYLEDLQTEFAMQYGSKIDSVSRPYSFIEFDTFIQKTKKTYMDSRSRRNFGQLNTELQDVQRIMVQNIDDVLQRGEALSALDDKASNLATLSQKYKKDAHYLNLRSSYFKIAAIVVVIIVFLLLIRYWLF